MTQRDLLITHHWQVVNCFQICIFVSDDTAQYVASTMGMRCELLSNLYLCIGWHSLQTQHHNHHSVVNCFQICIFVSDDTATDFIASPVSPLWIAFKFVSLYRMTQLFVFFLYCFTCCELLSNLYLCIGWHSLPAMNNLLAQVVNCFQICIFVSDDTARWSQIITNQSDTKISH